MEWMDRERNFWLVGGDGRQLALAKLLEEEGHTVHVSALEGGTLVPEPLGPGLTLAHCVILPLPVTQAEGLLHTPLSGEKLPLSNLLAHLSPGQILCGGLVKDADRQAAEDRGLRVFDYYAREECMVANAVPTAVPMGPAEGRGLAAHPQKSFPGSGKSPRLSAIIAVADRRTLPKESVFLTIGGTKHERSAV